MAQEILTLLADHARARVAAAKAAHPVEEVRAAALALPKGDFAFERALARPGLRFICECKRASPSKGLIAPEFPYLAISVLTEPKWFLGSDRYLREIAAAVPVPCLRKDFTVDEYMIYEARLLGASAVLLICSILDDAALCRDLELCETLGLSALVEAHDSGEVARAVAAGTRVIGVNNRNLKDFSVDVTHCLTLRQQVPPGVLFVAESGILTPADVAALRAAGADAVLVGETLMRAADKTAALHALRGDCP